MFAGTTAQVRLQCQRIGADYGRASCFLNGFVVDYQPAEGANELLNGALLISLFLLLVESIVGVIPASIVT